MNCKDDCDGGCGCSKDSGYDRICFLCEDLSEVRLPRIEIRNPTDNSKMYQAPICGVCAKFLEKQFAVKCITCGCGTFIPRTVKSVFYFADSNLHNGIVTVNWCPNCTEAKSQGAVPSGVIH